MNISFEMRLVMENVANIAYMAGESQYIKHDSVTDNQQFIDWAIEFEDKWCAEKEQRDEFDTDYRESIEAFTKAKLQGLEPNWDKIFRIDA